MLMQDDSRVELKREVSLMSGISIIVGTIIGSGIFISSTDVYKYAGESVGCSLLVWTFSGFMSLLGALCYAELGTSIQSSGGEYTYIKIAFGEFAAFLQLWINLMIIQPTAIALVALTFSYYVLHPLSSCRTDVYAIQFVALLCIGLITFINVFKVSWAVRLQNVFTFAKLAILFVIIITGFVMLGKGSTDYFHESFRTTKPISAETFSLSLFSCLYSYAGWNFLNMVTEEIKQPEKNLPRAICISVVVVTIFYVLCNVAYFTVLSPMEILQSRAVAQVFGQRMFGDAAFLVSIFVGLSCFGGVNGLLLVSSRLTFVGAREGQLPPLLGMVHINRMTPVPAIVTLATISMMMVVWPNIEKLINYMSFAQWLSIGASVCSLFYLRVTQPNMIRPIKLPLIVPFIFLLCCVYLVILPWFVTPKDTFIGFLFILTGIPVYICCIVWRTKPVGFKRNYCEIQHGELDTETMPVFAFNLLEAGSIDVGVFFSSQSLSPTHINSNSGK